MSELLLMKGNEAIGEAAIRAGCRFFFGYPITPQSELPAYMSKRLVEAGGIFLQAESEVAAISMVYGAAGAGARVMTSSSSPGVSLKMEGISYMVGSELPGVIVNIERGGPGLGNIMPAQSDYFQAVKGGGHGDYNMVVYGPANIQELVDCTIEAFEIADRYRNPVMILGDGMLGQMMEPVRFPEKSLENPVKPWATIGRRGVRPKNIVNSLFLDGEACEKHNLHLQNKFRRMKENEVRYEIVNGEDAEVMLVAFGTCSRIARSAMDQARAEGLKVGLIRPISLWPFPDQAFHQVLPRVKAFLTVEMNYGQMVEDVRLSVNGRTPVHFYGRAGGMWPLPRDIVAKLKEIAEGGAAR